MRVGEPVSVRSVCRIYRLRTGRAYKHIMIQIMIAAWSWRLRVLIPLSFGRLLARLLSVSRSDARTAGMYIGLVNVMPPDSQLASSQTRTCTQSRYLRGLRRDGVGRTAGSQDLGNRACVGR